jgi:hypothetical protein
MKCKICHIANKKSRLYKGGEGTKVLSILNEICHAEPDHYYHISKWVWRSHFPYERVPCQKTFYNHRTRCLGLSGRPKLMIHRNPIKEFQKRRELEALAQMGVIK